MAVSGVGSSFSYIYNSKTGKLSSKDGSSNEFTEYFNGNLEGKDSSTLNGFDAGNKGSMKRLVELFEEGVIGKNILDSLDGDEYEISGEIVDAVTSEYAVNGRKIFTCYGGMPCTPVEIGQFISKQPFKTRQSKPYDAVTNSINIAVGDVFDLGDGYRLTVKGDYIYGEGYGKDREKDKKVNLLERALEALVHFADQQWMAATIDVAEGGSDILLEFLKEQGVDTDREFTVNGTKCEVRNGKIREVGNYNAVPGSAYEKALKRSEELAYMPLCQRMA